MRLRVRVLVASGKESLRRKQRAVEAALRNWRPKAGELVRGIMVQVIRERQKAGSGATSNSVQWRPTPGGFFVGPTTANAGFIDKPTRPHVIRPVRAKALAFARSGGTLTRSRSTGHVRTRFRFGGGSITTGPVFATIVNHPGTKGLDFTGETARRAPQPLAATLADEVHRALGAA
jgi:hypothetical protein